uniref:Sperm-associated antigen 5 n=1 Tax=Gadus morhua TaxID=8049 RepID=A0A8C5D0S1_GADMO
MQSTPSSKPHSRLPATVDVSDTTVNGCSILDASTACSGDITFKSFACMDGDIEILDYSDAAEDSIVLPTHQPSKSWIHRDLTISESIIINESESKHIDHAYVNQEEGNGASKNMNAQQEPTLVNGCREHPGDEFIMSSVGEDSGDQDHTDHPYSSKECRFSCSIEQSPKLRDGPTDITLRSFVCTGGEVELSDTTTVAEQTIPVPSVQLGISNYLAKDESIINQSELAANQIIDPFKGHLEHCYFNNDFLNIPSPSSDLKAPQEPLSSSAEAPQLDEHDSVTDGGKSTGPFESLRDTAADVNSTDAFILLEKPLPLSEDPAEFSPTSYNDIRAVSIVESHDPDSQHKQPCALKRDESIEAAPANDAVITVANIQKLQDVSQTVLSPVEVIAAGYCSDFLAEISVLDRESLVEKMPYAVPLMGPLESPISRPLFNSTALRTRYLATPRVSRHREVPEQLPPARGSVVAASAGPASQELRGLPDPPLILDGFQKQRLRQVAEYLFLTSEKMPTGPAPFALAAIAPPAVKSHSICVGTSPVKWVDCCFNTSGQFVRKREISVADGCTATDPLLWNVPPGSLEGLPKQELEQRLRSHMINVEVLLQQLDASRGQKSTPAGPPPSQLRDVLVQTDHTELNQTSTYRDLYMTALGRIQELEMDQSSLQSLIQAVEETKITAPDSIFLVRFQAFSVTEQLRAHCAQQISEMKQSVGCHQELMEALKKTYPEQVDACTPADTGTGIHRAVTLSPSYLTQSVCVSVCLPELGVLRQKLSEGEEERALLERKVSELSATISSTLASYTFLEQSLISESVSAEKTLNVLIDGGPTLCLCVSSPRLEALLGPSEQRVGELSRALAHSEQQLGLLQAHCQAQAQQLQLLEDTCTQLSSAREMNEFLQMENEAVREQTVEIEELYQASLQGLRERNNQCEDLKGAVSRLQLEKASVEADLEATRSRASHAQQSLGEQLVQGVTSLTVQLHTLKGLTHSLHVALGEQVTPPPYSPKHCSLIPVPCSNIHTIRTY